MKRLRSVVALLTLAVLATATPATLVTPVMAESGAPALTLRFDAWGPLKLGMTNQQAWQTGMVSRRVSGCAAGYDLRDAYSRRGYIVWSGDFPAMTVKEIVINGTVDATARGIHVGSTLGQLRSAYPTLSRMRSGSSFGHGSTTGPDNWVISKRSTRGVLSFQFPYGPKPTRRTKIEMIIIAGGPQVFWGC